MFTVTSVLGKDNYVTIPDSLCEEWVLMNTDFLYASMRRGALFITKEKRINTAALEILRLNKTILPFENIVLASTFGFYLPDYLVKALKIKVGSEVLFTLDEDRLWLSRSKEIFVFSRERTALRLVDKLTREFEEAQASQYGIKYSVLMEDIYMFLLLGNWDDATARALLEKPTPMQDLLLLLRNDEEFDKFFDKKLLALLKGYIAQ